MRPYDDFYNRQLLKRINYTKHVERHLFKFTPRVVWEHVLFGVHVINVLKRHCIALFQDTELVNRLLLNVSLQEQILETWPKGKRNNQ